MFPLVNLAIAMNLFNNNSYSKKHSICDYDDRKYYDWEDSWTDEDEREFNEFMSSIDDDKGYSLWEEKK